MIKEVQGLRAIAILMVLFIHCVGILPQEYHERIFKLQNIFFTSIGVEIFFVLAGYFLISSLNRYERSDISINLNNLIKFLIKKFKRLAPTVYFYSLIALVFSFLGHGTEAEILWQEPMVVVKKFFSTLLFYAILLKL